MTAPERQRPALGTPAEVKITRRAPSNREFTAEVKPAPDCSEITQFVERMKRERSELGLPPTITDSATLRVIAALVAHRKGCSVSQPDTRRARRADHELAHELAARIEVGS
jgi:hypothetical protein